MKQHLSFISMLMLLGLCAGWFLRGPTRKAEDTPCYLQAGPVIQRENLGPPALPIQMNPVPPGYRLRLSRLRGDRLTQKDIRWVHSILRMPANKVKPPQDLKESAL